MPPLTHQQALEILSRPANELKMSSDYYKAAFHLARYPGLKTEEALIDLVESKSLEQSVVLGRRKAVDTLAKLGCVRAIPSIGNCLNSSDPYLVETAAWALQSLKCKDVDLIKRLILLLDDPIQHRRSLIKSISALGDQRVLDKIKAFIEDPSTPIGIRGASISAMSSLFGQREHILELHDHLRVDNQNDRHCAFHDIVDSKDFNQLGILLRAPVSPSFRLQAINLLWPKDILKKGQMELTHVLDKLITDHPKEIDVLTKYASEPKNSFLVKELFGTDFNRCYLALKTLLNRETKELEPLLDDVWDKIYKDYGAIYFFVQLFNLKSGWSRDGYQRIQNLLLFSLGNSWPDYMKFRPISILTLTLYRPDMLHENLSRWLDHEKTPYWVSRYATLMALETSLKDHSFRQAGKYLKYCLQDSHRFVRVKAKAISHNYGFT
ncbi:bilin biosynthesis protein CpeY [Prochlorococcus sp. MIT 1341]|uniref:HEAT repeat domain-containing protein n=1 Tax=Prochlorococcus sp. MIT 1341 TaxID=3096221 RepID=UPI002A75BBF0|nr:bilin biosynthesis protein CpeY [Prochlorococcus sp. MIT 1341]